MDGNSCSTLQAENGKHSCVISDTD